MKLDINTDIEKSLDAPAGKDVSSGETQETLEEFKANQNQAQFPLSGSTNQNNNFQSQSGGLGNINFPPQIGVANNPGIGVNQQNTLGQANQFNDEKSI